MGIALENPPAAEPSPPQAQLNGRPIRVLMLTDCFPKPSNDSGICKVMTDGQDGRTLPPRDIPAAAAALEQLLADDELRLLMGQAAFSLSERRLNMRSIALKTLSLLHDAALSNAAHSA